MAQEVNIITKHIQKHDYEVNWLKSSLIPAKGQIIVYDREDLADKETDELPELPKGRTSRYNYERFKIGDGTQSVSDLPFATQMDWNQNDESAADYIKNRTHYSVIEVSDEIYYGSDKLTLSGDIYEGTVYTTTYEEYEWVAFNSAWFRVVINDKEYHLASDAMFEETTGIGLTNLGDFVQITISKSLLNSQAEKLDVVVYAYQRNETIHTLDAKYIPATIARTSAVNTLNNTVNTLKNTKYVKSINGIAPNSSGAVTFGYDNLKTRPFNYYYELSTIILDNFDGQAFSFEDQGYTSGHNNCGGYYKGFDYPSIADVSGTASVYQPINIIWDGVEYLSVECAYEDILDIYGEYWDELRYYGDPQLISYPFFICLGELGNIDPRIYASTAGLHTIKITAVEKSEVSKINSIHIPDTIARKSELKAFATLEDGKVPAVQLPSYVDDVIEYNTITPRPETGEAGKIYVNTDDNKTYRWSGSAYVEISASLALGETASTAFAGDKGKAAYNHSQVTASVGNNPHGITKETLGVVETYTNTDPLLSNVGGILASKHTNGFDNVPITDLITELLYPYTKPAVSNFAMTPATGVKEMNSSINVTKATVNVTKKSKNIASINLYKGSNLVQSITDNVAGGGTFTFSLSDSLDGSTDTAYQIKVKDIDGGETVTSSLTYDFVYPYFYGVVAAGTSNIVSDTVTGLTKSIKAKANGNFTFTTNNQCPVIAYPASYGELKSIVDPNNFSQTWTRYIVTVNNGSTINGISYYVYVGDAATAENVKYTFNY